MKKAYAVKKFESEIKRKDRSTIQTGCCLEDENPEVIGKFDNLQDAIEKLKKHEPELARYGSYYQVTEFAVEIYKEDEDGEFIEGSDYDMAYDFSFNEETDALDISPDRRFLQRREV